MKTATIRDLRHDTTTVLSWVAHGESVEVRRHGKPVAVLSPRPRKPSVVRPDFLARIRGVYGDRVLATSATELVSEVRGEM
ncbi:MAG: type II toxin-antitoxin system Phd/YefM family antitoxin [Kiritimatiellia bacterium]